ncbi:response regulator [Dasania sp. GY-MA-18]|uniref:Response regulator n=1 Tax=Dasania phycosphaerae TaxID=2950436 RepID=A0A9J6RIU9_9GAMM|nr:MULTISPECIES: tetratricopeptide repeat-containing response regulator [Dasania]MCR8921748.1 response regulator [Dasania sp. GY-MA-18]MCZ0864176.1 response regulator [Dasania phycosphaerae]MCZ0867904.1 response regulator [Dasania phycosphaerae]
MVSPQLALFKLFKQKTALIIDDYPDMRGSIRRMLVNFGVESIDTASNGDEAILKCDDNRYDIILADYNLGDGKSGQQILEEMRYKGTLKQTSLYMMITAETTKSMVFGALEYQPDDYLTKPFTQSVLQKRLGRMVLEKEALHEIYKAMDMLDFDLAIELCKNRIALHDKYESRCHRIMGSCFYKKHKYSQAKELYKNVLSERDVEWASIGLGKSLMALNELEEAEEIFGKLIDNGCQCLEIYDCMADIKVRKGEAEQAQLLLEKAAAISPNAILRQEKIAELAEANHDWASAEAAHKKVIRLGNNSVYETPEHHFNLARCISAELKHSKDKPAQRIKDAQEILRRARRKYKNHDNIHLQSDIIEAGVYADAGDEQKAKEKVAASQARIEQAENKSVQLSLDMAKTFKAIGDDKKSMELLTDLAKKYADDPDICMKIDAMSDEPITEHGKRKAIELNQTGKKLFGNKEFNKAIQLFSQALMHYPNNAGLNLNLMLALVKKMNVDGVSPKGISRGREAASKLEHLESDHVLYDRFQAVNAHLEKLAQNS